MQSRVLLRGVAAVLIGAFLLTGPVAAEDPQPPKPGPEDRCPVCGMFVHKFDLWVAAITFADGSSLFFDGPKDLFRYYLQPEDYRKSGAAEEITAIYVTDYYSTAPIPARDALFVLGSEVLGPMGKELVPVRDEEAAETFRRDHQGERVIAFDEVELSDLAALE